MDDQVDTDVVHMLTTVDNPFNPFTQYNEWYAFDEEQGYHSCAYLARIVKSSDELSEKDNAIAIDIAIDEIISINSFYRKVTKEGFKDISKQAKV